MLKKIKLKNSTSILIGIIIITIGVAIGLYEYFEERKNKTFSDMNIVLYEKEQPKNLETSEDISNDDLTINNREEQENTLANESVQINYLGILEIPKINLKKGFFGLDSPYNGVDYNITVINGSTFPTEENNNLILAAHSGDCPVCYFEDLYKLKLGDKAYLDYNNTKYSYKIVDIYTVEKDGTVTIYRDYKKSVLTLITCTRNSDTKQTVYILEEI